MENQMSINDEIFDLLLKEALIEKYNRDVKAAMENARPHDFSPELEKRIRKISRSIGRKERIRGICKGLIKFLVIAAAVMGIAFGGLLTQPTVFAAVTSVIRQVFDKSDDYYFSGSELTLEDFNSEMRFRYIPERYYLSEGHYSPVNVQLIYTNESDEIIFEYFIAKGVVLSIDNEHNSYEIFYRNNIEYHYYESFDDDFYNS
ncbi:MAG: hypothetical protein J1F11_13575, partial [Oscillospiraceae bacterium]|nr:hypothetical protein [Oscillospiraceae bacterium]